MKPFKHEALYVFKEDAGEWQAALQIFWEIKMLQSGELSSTHCFDILNRVFVKAGQWRESWPVAAFIAINELYGERKLHPQWYACSIHMPSHHGESTAFSTRAVTHCFKAMEDLCDIQ